MESILSEYGDEVDEGLGMKVNIAPEIAKKKVRRASEPLLTITDFNTFRITNFKAVRI
jgi:hypothetical protein